MILQCVHRYTYAFQQWQQIFTPTLYFPKHTLTSAHSSLPLFSSCSSLLAYASSLVIDPITTKGMGTGAGVLQDRCPKRHSTHDSPLNFDLTLGAKRATRYSLYCVTKGDAAQILLRSQMEDHMQLFLQEHVL